MTLPPVHVLIVNFNNWRYTVDCLDSVVALDYPDVRIVLCDNGSTDDSLAQLARCRDTPAGRSTPFELLSLPANGGFTGGNNAGLRHLLATAAAGYVWLLNNDTIVRPAALRAMVELAERTPNVGAVAGTMLEYADPEVVQTAGGGTISFWTGMASHAFAGVPRSTTSTLRPQLNYLSGGCMLIPMEVVRDIGLLDERFFIYAEDADLSIRIAESGRLLLYCAEAEILHKGGATMVNASPFHDYQNLRSSLLFVHKHNSARLPAAVAYSLYRCVLSKVVRGQWGRLPAAYRAYRDAFTTIVRGIPQEKHPEAAPK